MTLQEATQHVTTSIVGWGIYLGAPIASGVFAMFAATDTSMLGSLMSSLGASGILAWYVYYHVKYVLPRHEARADKREAEMRTHYEGIIEKIEANDREKNREICKSLDGVACALGQLSNKEDE